MLDKERMQEQGRAMAMKASQLGKNICSTESARELNKLATQKRKENNQRAKSLQETAKFFMKLAVDKNCLLEPEQIMDISSTENKQLTGIEAIVLAQTIKAINGDTQSAIFLRDIIGEKPADKVEIGGMTIDEYAKNHKVKL